MIPDQLKKLLSDTTSVKFGSGTPDEYDPDDCTLDGINAIHLAARFHAKSLLVIVNFLRQNKFLESFKDILEAPDPHMGKRPLHLAIQSPSHLTTMILLACGVNIEATDKRGYTALHMAAAEGHEGHTVKLLENGANPNVFGQERDYIKTPLHRARTQKVVQHLLKYGADPCARMVDSYGRFCQQKVTFKEQPRVSVMDVFLRRYPTAIEEMFQNGITTNGQDLDSMDLQIIFNFELFFKEGLEYEISNDQEITDEDLENIDEMAAHSKIVDSQERDLLKHPLAEAYLHLKWQMIQKYLYFNMISYTIFLLALTSFVILQTEIFKCGGWENITTTECGEFHKQRPINETFEFNFFIIIGTYLNSNSPEVFNYAVLFIVLGCLTSLGFGYVTVREFWQAKCNFKRYVESRENYLELSILIGMIGYLVALMKYPLYSIHFGAWIVLLSWFEMMLMLGRIPSIGIYIYMSVNVFKTIIAFILVYSPLLIAFGTSFYILLPTKASFTNLPMAMIKSLTMMTGEFDLGDNFHWDESKEDFGQVSTQAFFIIFLIFISIVIANLLIGTYDSSLFCF